jgi:enoyl-CoA hydratase/carnithine racemase
VATTAAASWKISKPAPGVMLAEYLNPPENRLTARMLSELASVLEAAESDRDLACLVLASGLDGYFIGDTSEDDLEALRAARSPQSELMPWFQACSRLAGFPAIVIAAIDGLASGTGIELALCCDMRIVGKSARFEFPWLRSGLLPFAGGTQRLARLVGRSRALSLLASDRAVDAESAVALGLADEAAQGSARDRALDIATNLGRGNPEVARRLKTAMQGSEVPLQEGLALEARLASSILRSEREPN